MIQKVLAPISVIVSYNHKTRVSFPRRIEWEGRSHDIKKIGFHHTFRDGRVLIHSFSVQSETLYFKLHFNTESLNWTVQEISDGEPD